ncbi:MAG: hypothetical protein J6M25_05560 [Prevotella sp.]|nr:hypothetical protein [Prevotella sp.]
MKRKGVLIIMMLLMLVATRAATRSDSLVLLRVFNYQQNYAKGIDGFTTNVYFKHVYQTHKRNAALWVVPSMYAIARGQRTFISEQYSKFTFRDIDNYENRSQVYYTTIPHHRRTMPVLLEFLTPNLYHPTLYGDHILSPFNRSNRVFYRYRIVPLTKAHARLYFRPRFVNNTQLVSGQAIVETPTGRIMQVEMNGEFDMIRFKTFSMQGTNGTRALLPRLNRTDIDFHFMGNHITSHFEAVFDCPITLPDSVSVKGDRHLIDSVRPYSLTEKEQAIYDYYDSLHHATATTPTIYMADSVGTQQSAATASPDTLPTRTPRHNYLKEIGWDMIGENLIKSLKAQSGNGYVKLSPLINPQYISYSQRKGFSYKLKLGAQYNFSENVSLNFRPTLGYNFKLHQLYYKAPLRLTFNPDRDGRINMEVGNGNRISNSSVIDEIRAETGNETEGEGQQLDLFDDLYFNVSASYSPLSWLNVEPGFVFHQRNAVNRQAMRYYAKPTKYRSFAPMISVKIRPYENAPLLTIDYERGLKSHRTALAYERWEADLAIKHRMTRMQLFNMRLGGGLYTRRDHNYFMDFSNFRDENLPEGWDDDWSGNFQLLSSRLYNASSYYVRGNISYESPLLLASMTPLLGRYVERERAYISSLLIQDTRLYSELGYGFTCRYFSMGVFASFLALRHQEVGCKFTFELFRRW